MRSVQAPSPLLGAVCPRIPVIGCFKPVSARPWARRQHALRRQRSPGAVLCSRTELDAPETGFEASEPGPPEEASSAPALEEEEDEDEEEPRRSPIEEKLYAKFWELLDKEDISLKRGQKVGLDDRVRNGGCGGGGGGSLMGLHANACATAIAFFAMRASSDDLMNVSVTNCPAPIPTRQVWGVVLMVEKGSAIVDIGDKYPAILDLDEVAATWTPKTVRG